MVFPLIQRCKEAYLLAWLGARTARRCAQRVRGNAEV